MQLLSLKNAFRLLIDSATAKGIMKEKHYRTQAPDDHANILVKHTSLEVDGQAAKNVHFGLEDPQAWGPNQRKH